MIASSSHPDSVPIKRDTLSAMCRVKIETISSPLEHNRSHHGAMFIKEKINMRMTHLPYLTIINKNGLVCISHVICLSHNLWLPTSFATVFKALKILILY